MRYALHMMKIALAVFALLGLIIFWVHDLIAFALAPL